MLTNDTTEIAMRLYENKSYGKTNGPGLYKKALFNGTIDVKAASEMNNTAGKIINTQRVQIEYASLRNEAPNIPFMGG